MTDFKQIVEKYGPIVWQSCYRLLGNQVEAFQCFQETFLSAVRQYHGQKVTCFSTFLIHKTTSLSIDRLKKRLLQSGEHANSADLVLVSPPESMASDQVQRLELAGQLRRAIAHLPVTEAEVFCMKSLNDLSYRKISKQLAIKSNTASVLDNRAKKKLTELLSKILTDKEIREKELILKTAVKSLMDETTQKQPPQDLSEQVIEDLLQQYGQEGGIFIEEKITIAERIAAMSKSAKAALVSMIIIIFIILAIIFSQDNQQQETIISENKDEKTVDQNEPIKPAAPKKIIRTTSPSQETPPPDEPEDISELELELEEVIQLFLEGDIEGLLEILEQGSFEAQVLAANCLGRIADERAIEPLEQAYLSTKDFFAEGEEQNPFEKALTDIRNRLQSKKQTEPNEAVIDSNDKTIENLFRQLDYSLRDEPLRVLPQTLNLPNPAAEEAIVLGQAFEWQPTNFSSTDDTVCGVVEKYETFERFTVTAPNRRKTWVRKFDNPIDMTTYPIVVIKYRAVGINENSSDFAVFLNDGGQSWQEGIAAVSNRDIIADGGEHTIAFDISLLEPKGSLTDMAISVLCSESGLAQFDLIDMRFESTQQSQPESINQAAAFIISVVDEAAQPIEAAFVEIDPQRYNWMKAGVTDFTGKVTVKPLENKIGRHTIRISKSGMVTTEIEEAVSEEKTLEITLIPAVFYGGLVLDENGEPLASAAVHIKIMDTAGLIDRIRKEAAVLTDNEGRWRSPQFPEKVTRVQIEIAHPRYDGGSYISSHEPNIAELKEGEAVLMIQQ